VGYRAVLQNLRIIYKLKLPHLTEGQLIKQLLLKGKKKTGETPQSPDKTKTEPLLKYQHQDWRLKE
jgi:hypothetical protein